MDKKQREEEYIYPEYQTMTDEELVYAAREGEKNSAMECLFYRYRGFVRSRTYRYYFMGADREDVFQEGMIGFFKAYRDYRKDQGSSFRAFAGTCVERQLITALKSYTRMKHIPLNHCFSLNHPLITGERDICLQDLLVDESSPSPEEGFVNEETMQAMCRALSSLLSDMERRVFCAFLRGDTYRDIAGAMGCSLKAVDNAVQRVKQKIERNRDKLGGDAGIACLAAGLARIRSHSGDGLQVLLKATRAGSSSQNKRCPRTKAAEKKTS